MLQKLSNSIVIETIEIIGEAKYMSKMSDKQAVLFIKSVSVGK